MNTTTKSRETKTLVTLTEADSGFGFMLVCEEHGLCCEFDTKSLALSFRPYPSEWCEECGKIIYAATNKAVSA